jgi:hypothetical protein
MCILKCVALEGAIYNIHLHLYEDDYKVTVNVIGPRQGWSSPMHLIIS